VPFGDGAASASTGKKVKATGYSWLIGIGIGDSKSVHCGGALIGDGYVLTAAHCVDRNDIGDSEYKPYSLKEVVAYSASTKFGEERLAWDHSFAPVAHHGYKKNGKTHEFDVALLRLAKQPDGAVTAPVSSRRLSPGRRDGSQKAILSGWGQFLQSEPGSPPGRGGDLRAEKVELVSPKKCQPWLNKREFSDAWLCSVGYLNGACRGDSGGPLVVGSLSMPQTIGIVSFGRPTNCKRPRKNSSSSAAIYWSIYTRSSSIAHWVAQETGTKTVITNLQPGK